MNHVPFRVIPLQASRFSGIGRTIRRVLFGSFLVLFAFVWAQRWLPMGQLGTAHWTDGLLVILATATLIASLTSQLPGQNVILVSIIIAFIGSAAETVGALTAIPFGPFVYTENIGQQLFNPLPWAIPMLWIIFILTSRGTARLALRPWRKTRAYGFRLIGLTVLLVVLLDLGLEPFATRVERYWVWNPTKINFDWYSAPCVNFLGWALISLLILAFATPWFLNKKPAQSSPPDYRPLIVWLLLNLLFATGAATHQLWPAVALVSLSSIVVAIFAVRGARW